MFDHYSLAAQNLIDEAIGIAAAMEGSISYETVFHSTFYERSRMLHFLERRNEKLKMASKRH